MDATPGTPVEYQTSQQVYQRGKQLEGMTFRQVLDLGISPEGAVAEYNSRKYKGGMGTLIEERFFGYRANSDREPERGDRAAEFEKAGIRVRTLRPEPDGKRLVESSPILNIDFLALAAERDWEDSELRDYLSDMRYLFVVFQKESDCTVLRGCKVWGMPDATLDGPVRECWLRTRDVVVRGVTLTRKVSRTGKVSYSNDFPSISDDLVAHVRPRAARAAYRFLDGTEVGNVERDAEELPDGRWMTRQAFWLNSGYVLGQISDLI